MVNNKMAKFDLLFYMNKEAAEKITLKAKCGEAFRKKNSSLALVLVGRLQFFACSWHPTNQLFTSRDQKMPLLTYVRRVSIKDDDRVVQKKLSRLINKHILTRRWSSYYYYYSHRTKYLHNFSASSHHHHHEKKHSI